jgi:hypothetical protein
MMTSGQTLPEPVRKMGYVSANPPFKTNGIEEQKFGNKLFTLTWFRNYSLR